MTEKPHPPDDLWDAVDNLANEDHQPRFNEGFTISEFAERYSLPQTTAAGRIRILLRAEKIEQGWMLKDSRWTRVYRPKK